MNPKKVGTEATITISKGLPMPAGLRLSASLDAKLPSRHLGGVSIAKSPCRELVRRLGPPEMARQLGEKLTPPMPQTGERVRMFPEMVQA